MKFFKEVYRNRYTIPDTTVVDTYSWGATLRAGRRLPEASAPRPPVSLVATVKNEGHSLGEWFESILAQSRLPDEIVIVDGGSTDDTWSTLHAYAARSPMPVRLLRSAGANIARGRNLAIDAAAGPIIACTDAGCMLPREWLAALTGPFVDDDIEVSAGYYRAATSTNLESAMAAYFVQPIEAIDPQTFLPSARSMAFTKEAWSRAGGFPEWLQLTAEDTLFDVKLKRVTQHWAFVPEAQVEWRLRSTLRALFAQVQTYAHGDGEAGLFPDEYRQRINLWIGLLVTVIAGAGGIVLWLVSSSVVWLMLTAVAIALLARRIRQITLYPAWASGGPTPSRATLQSMLVVLTITLAMSIGFLKGVRLRTRRLVASSPEILDYARFDDHP